MPVYAESQAMLQILRALKRKHLRSARPAREAVLKGGRLQLVTTLDCHPLGYRVNGIIRSLVV